MTTFLALHMIHCADFFPLTCAERHFGSGVTAGLILMNPAADPCSARSINRFSIHSHQSDILHITITKRFLSRHQSRYRRLLRLGVMQRCTQTQPHDISTYALVWHRGPRGRRKQCGGYIGARLFYGILLEFTIHIT